MDGGDVESRGMSERAEVFAGARCGRGRSRERLLRRLAAQKSDQDPRDKGIAGAERVFDAGRRRRHFECFARTRERRALAAPSDKDPPRSEPQQMLDDGIRFLRPQIPA